MAWTEPNTIIKFYRGINIDKQYENTLYFSNVSEQESFFHDNNPLLRWAFPRHTFQRVSSNKVRVEKSSALLDDCNYMAFQNSAYDTKWFYAFVLDVEYVNEKTSEVTYEIDVIQTYMFNANLGMCFVEREHSRTDNVGDNIVPENFDVGDYFYGMKHQTHMFDEYGFCMLLGWNITGELPQPDRPTKFYGAQTVTGNVNALNTVVYGGKQIQTETALEFIQNDLAALDEHQDEIMAIYMVPVDFLPRVSNLRGHLPTECTPLDVTVLNTKPTKLGDYTPTNKKLLTAPFNMLNVTTFDGNDQDYMYEYFDGEGVYFKLYGNLTANTSFKFCPQYYKNQDINYNEGMVLTDFPMVAYSIDAFKVWLGQNKTRVAVKTTSAIASAVVGNYRGAQWIGRGLDNIANKNYNLGVAQSIRGTEMRENANMSLANSVGGMLGEIASARAQGMLPQGSPDGSLELAMGVKDFNWQQKYVNPKTAKLIDDYFTMFGYATKEVKEVSRKNRTEYTYVKTNGCIAKSSTGLGCPSSALEVISNIHDKGIRYWVHNENVGDFSISNEPLE